jgi:hypothetical protein
MRQEMTEEEREKLIKEIRMAVLQQLLSSCNLPSVPPAFFRYPTCEAE